MLVTTHIWHIYVNAATTGFVDIDSEYLLLDPGEAAGYYYSGCWIVEFDFDQAPLWFVKRSMTIEPIPIYKAKDLYRALSYWVPDFMSIDLTDMGIW